MDEVLMVFSGHCGAMRSATLSDNTADSEHMFSRHRCSEGAPTAPSIQEVFSQVEDDPWQQQRHGIVTAPSGNPRQALMPEHSGSVHVGGQGAIQLLHGS